MYGKKDGKFAAEVGGFLAAEAADDDGAAETSLKALFGGLPKLEPGADFAGRVMARIALAPRRLPRALARVPRDLPRAFRWPLAVAMLASGVAAFFLLPTALLFGSRIGPGGALKATAGIWAALGERLAGLAWVYQLGRQLLAALFEVAGSPPVLLGLVAAAALATLLSRWLLILLEPSRRTSDAALS